MDDTFVIWPYVSERLTDFRGLTRVLSIHFPVVTEETHRLSVRTDDLLARFKPGTHRIRRMIVNRYTAMFGGHRE
jgi:hypothetical protein